MNKFWFAIFAALFAAPFVAADHVPGACVSVTQYKENPDALVDTLAWRDAESNFDNEGQTFVYSIHVESQDSTYDLWTYRTDDSVELSAENVAPRIGSDGGYVEGNFSVDRNVYKVVVVGPAIDYFHGNMMICG